MIKILAEYYNESLIHLSVIGHGGLPYGKDVVCAGVSSCVIGALNALNNAENYQIDIHEGYVDIKCVNEETFHDEVVLETLIVQLTTISKSYSDRVKIIVSRKEGNK